MSSAARLTLYLTLMSSISFGGIPSVLPDIRHFVVVANPWLSDRDFADFFALAQTIPGPNMILMMSLVGWKIAGMAGAAAGAAATALPPCTMYVAAYRLLDRFRDAAWQKIARTSFAPLTFGLIVAGGAVMAETADKNVAAAAITAAATGFVLATRRNPLWMIGVAGLLGALGLI